MLQTLQIPHNSSTDPHPCHAGYRERMAVEREWARKLNAAQLESLQKVAEAELYAKGKAAEAEAVSWIQCTEKQMAAVVCEFVS